MLFPTLDYLLFLPIVLGLYWAVPRTLRIWVAGLASLLFYASLNIEYLPALLLVSGVAWTAPYWMKRWQRWLGVLVVMLPLLAFKYWNWICWNIEALSQAIGNTVVLPHLSGALPVGISFFTFQAIAYAIDVKKNGKGEKSFGYFFSFICFFPQLVAGPIVRQKELLPQLKKTPLMQRGMAREGIYRIIKGMVKKLLIADVMSVAIVDPVFMEPGDFTGLEVLVALYAYTLQIYYDFSAYTDIAIGSALFFGIRLPENFNRPYKATSVAEFWRRWHITLSNWARDYIYYPLGGSQISTTWKIYRNIIATMLVIGIWHGASWNFVIYGILHGTAVSINRVQRKRTGRRAGMPFEHWTHWLWRFLLTFHFVVIARILFRAEGLYGSVAILESLLNFHLVLPRFSPLAWLIFAAGYAIHFSPVRLEAACQRFFCSQKAIIQSIIAAFAAMICWKVGTGDQLYFVYYQF